MILDRRLGKGAGGLTLCLALKKNLHTRPIPVIVLAGLSRPDEECKGCRFGADLYLRRLGTITGACMVPVRSYGYRLRPFLDASSGPAEYPRSDDGALDARMDSAAED